MNVFAKFDEIPSMILQDIKETKRYGHKNVSDTRSDVKTVYPPTNTVCRGYNNVKTMFNCYFLLGLGKKVYHMSCVVRKLSFAYAKTKTQISFAISAFVFAT